MLNYEIKGGYKPTDATTVNIYWSDDRLCYWGWMYKNGDFIGDFNAPDYDSIKGFLPQFFTATTNNNNTN